MVKCVKRLFSEYHQFWTTVKVGFGNKGERGIGFAVSSHGPAQIGLHPVLDPPKGAFEGRWKIS